MATTTPRYVLPLLLLVGIGVIVSGCVPIGTTTTRNDRRYPDDASRAPTRTERVVYTRVSRDADRYVHTLDRTLRLNRRQEQRIARLLSERAYDRVRRTRARDQDRAYPFPRRYADRYTRDWWRDADRRIERELDRWQRRVYRDLVRDHKRRAERNRPRGNGRGHRPGRGRGNGRG